MSTPIQYLSITVQVADCYTRSHRPCAHTAVEVDNADSAAVAVVAGSCYKQIAAVEADTAAAAVADAEGIEMPGLDPVEGGTWDPGGFVESLQSCSLPAGPSYPATS